MFHLEICLASVLLNSTLKYVRSLFSIHRRVRVYNENKGFLVVTPDEQTKHERDMMLQRRQVNFQSGISCVMCSHTVPEDFIFLVPILLNNVGTFLESSGTSILNSCT